MKQLVAEGAALVATMAWAAYLRLWQLDAIPFGIWYDEARLALDVIENVMKQGLMPILYSAHPGTLVFYLEAATMSLFGPTLFAVRLVPAIAGVLTVPVVYFAGRRMGGPWVAVVAAILTASLRWHVNWSRGIILDAAFVPLVIALVFLFLGRGFSRWRPLDFFLCGVAAGLGAYVYFPGRVALVGIGAAFFWGFVSRRWSWRHLVPAASVTAFGVLLVTAPLVSATINNPTLFGERLTQVSIFGQPDAETGGAVEGLISNVYKHALMFNVAGDRNGRHNVPGEPMLDPLTGALFLAGLWGAAFSIRRFWPFVLTSTFLAMLALGVLSLSFEAPQSLRSFGVFAPMVLLCAIPLGTAARLVSRAAARRILALGVVAGLAVLAPLGWVISTNYEAYFVRQPRNFHSWAEHSAAETIVGYRLSALSRENAEVYISSRFANYPSIRLIAPVTPPQRIIDGDNPLPIRTSKDTVEIIMSPDRPELLAPLRAYYPNVRVFEDKLNAKSPTSVLRAILTRADTQALEGFEVVARTPDGAEVKGRAHRLSSDDLFLRTLKAPYSLEAQGTLRVPASGDYAFKLEGSARAAVYLDESELLNAEARAIAVKGLPQGNHALRIVQDVPAGAAPVRVTWSGTSVGTASVDDGWTYLPPVSSSGLLARYYRNPDLSGPPEKSQIEPDVNYEPHVIPLGRPYGVEWTGSLVAPVEGDYRLSLEVRGGAKLFINGETVVQTDKNADVIVHLKAGGNPLRLAFADNVGRSAMRLLWQPPGTQKIVLVPSSALRPPVGRFR